MSMQDNLTLNYPETSNFDNELNLKLF